MIHLQSYLETHKRVLIRVVNKEPPTPPKLEAKDKFPNKTHYTA